MITDARVRDIRFALSCLGLEHVLANPKFKDFSVDDFSVFIDEASKLATEVVAPLNAPSDKNGARFYPKTARVATTKGFSEAFKTYSAGGWGVSSLPQEIGGVGLPESVALACAELFVGACPSFTMAPGLTRSATDVIATFGTPAQKAFYIENMIKGMWTGTMCLTESHAGSDVGVIKTTATPVDGKTGRYKIKGQKIFISFGDHDLTENIIHLVLARTPGSPKGTAGISLFIVPKMKIGADGKLTGKKNDVVCGGIEHKMGIHGSPTCTLNFGEKDDCEGEILGKVNGGMRHMFLMMNEARLLVGLQGEAIAAASYEGASAYAKDRLQGCSMREMKNPDAPRVPIITHEDVRRMLMTMKAHTESMRALVYAVAHYIDMSRHAAIEEDRTKYLGWVELLTPVVKAYCSDRGLDVANIGVQVHGGAGYCNDYPAEQCVRDVTITRIYEGTNGIQGQDFVFRKLLRDGGSAAGGFAAEMGNEVAAMKSHPTLGALAEKVEAATQEFTGILVPLLMNAGDPHVIRSALINACDILDVFGTIASAFYLLRQAGVAEAKLDALCQASADAETRAMVISSNEEAKFCFDKIETAKFFIDRLLPLIKWRIEVIKSGNESCLANVL